jgi:parallel beta-helix repeat protein
MIIEKNRCASTAFLRQSLSRSEIFQSACFLAVLAVAGTSVHADDNCDPGILNEIKGQMVLPPNCIYKRPIRITEGNTTLNCSGSSFVGNGSQKIGLLIDSLGKPMSDVTVKNCIFRDFASSGVRITWGEKDTKKGEIRDEIYKRTPTRIFLENIIVEGSGRNGIYIDDYVTDVTLQNSVVRDSGGGAVYLEFSSKGNRILKNKFINNGFRGDGKTKREALSVDSSSNNLIEGNLFQENAAGGIFLYKNCGEQFSSGEQVLRWMPSDENIVRHNVFVGERVGVWLASRQSKDLSKWDCGDPPIDRAGVYYQDFADSNRVQQNTFCRTAIPVRNEGNNNVFIDNKFDSSVKTMIDQPVSQRQKISGKPAVGNIISGNSIADCK